MLNTKGQSMRVSSILAGNAVRNLLRREISLNTKRKSMKESSILAGNAARNLLRREI